MLYELSDCRPHSSSDPFGATFPPGEGFFNLRLLSILAGSPFFYSRLIRPPICSAGAMPPALQASPRTFVRGQLIYLTIFTGLFRKK